MSLAVRIVCRPETAAGFRLASLAPRLVEPDAAGAHALKDELRAAGTGVVLMDEQLFDRLSGDERRLLGRRPLPIVVPFPAPEWRTQRQAAEAYILDLLRQVIGYRVRLK